MTVAVGLRETTALDKETTGPRWSPPEGELRQWCREERSRGCLTRKAMPLRFPLRAIHEDWVVDLVGAGVRTPFGPAARRPFRFAQGIFEGEWPSTLRM
jgi:hypothetical protein